MVFRFISFPGIAELHSALAAGWGRVQLGDPIPDPRTSIPPDNIDGTDRPHSPLTLDGAFA